MLGPHCDRLPPAIPGVRGPCHTVVVDQLGAAEELVVWHADECAVELKRIDQLFLQHALQRLTRNTFDHATDQPAVRERVITVYGTGRVHGYRICDATLHMLPIEDLGRTPDQLVDSIKTGTVRQRLSNRDRTFAMSGEFRPVLRDRVVVRREAAIDED